MFEEIKFSELDLVKSLPTKCEETPNDLMSIYKLCNRMEFLCEKSHGVGMNAFQVGIPWNVFIVKYEIGKYNYFVDCNYVAIGNDSSYSIEGCLSLPNRRFRVLRFDKVAVVGYQLKSDNGFYLEKFQKEFDRQNNDCCDTMPLCVVFQHEADHSRNLLIDRLGEEIIISG